MPRLLIVEDAGCLRAEVEPRLSVEDRELRLEEHLAVETDLTRVPAFVPAGFDRHEVEPGKSGLARRCLPDLDRPRGVRQLSRPGRRGRAACRRRGSPAGRGRPEEARRCADGRPPRCSSAAGGRRPPGRPNVATTVRSPSRGRTGSRARPLASTSSNGRSSSCFPENQ